MFHVLYPMSNVRRPIFDVWCPIMSYFWYLILISNVQCLMFDVRFLMSDVHSPMTHVPCTIFLPNFSLISCPIFTAQFFCPIFLVQLFVRFCSIFSPIFCLISCLFFSCSIACQIFCLMFCPIFCPIFCPTGRCLTSDVWFSKSHVPCPMSKVRFSMSDIWCRMSYFWCLLSYSYWDDWDGMIMTRKTRMRGWLGWQG